jgi:hypothetical protein
VARIEAIRMLLAYAALKGFKLYQMDVKSAFLNGYIEKEVYVRQPPGFENPKYLNHVYKLHKALYGLKQAPRVWYEHLKAFLLAKGFKMGSIDKTLFLLKQGTNTLLVQIYVDDIIFGGSSHALVAKFSKTMNREFEMSMMGELTFFLGLQIKQTREGTFVHQGKYTKDLLRKFNMGEAKPLLTPMSITTALDEDKKGEAMDQKEYRIMRYLRFTPEFGLRFLASSSLSLCGYSDADYVGCRVERKSTSGTCQFLGSSLVSWSSRKQSTVA